MTHIVLFDIDGTLISTGGAGGAALLHAFSQLFDVPEPGTVSFSGRTDRGIVSDLFRLHQIEDSHDNWLRLHHEYVQQLGVFLPQHEGRVLPGVAELLAALQQQADRVLIGLLTGNARHGARLKLTHYGLFHYFRFGGYGDQHLDRDDVARDALAECQRLTNGSEKNLIVIGDTPLDIRCARAIGAHSVAVATGSHDRRELANAQPDLLLDDLADATRIMEWLE